MGPLIAHCHTISNYDNMEVTTSTIACLQKQTERIRNVCILAHVDHGKTTLSDHLIASNGLIHPRLAGELRYMDSNEDEQARGITMKSSSISLLHVPTKQETSQESGMDRDGYLFNLIDSPGHVDFCSEVSTAARLSDGAFVLVDAVEGVCIQTHAVLRQAWEEKLEMCLVVNKIDRLILELGLDPHDAYSRIVSIVSNVNMIVSSFESERFISEADAFLEYQGDQYGDSDLHNAEEENDDDEDADEDYFRPEKGNVAFGSAFDGWAFTVQQFAHIYAGKLSCKAEPLYKALWGNFYFSPKSKKIMPIKRGAAQSPLFVSWILDPIWKAYQACMPHADHKSVLGAIVEKLSLGEDVGKSVSHSDSRVALRALMRSWLSLSRAILTMGVMFLPNPKQAAPNRISRFLPKAVEESESYNEEVGSSLEAIESAICSCDTSDTAPLVLYVSKMISVPSTSLPRKLEQRSFKPNEEVFLAFGRVFAGKIREHQDVYVLQADYNPHIGVSSSSITKVRIKDLYLMMGRGLEALHEVPAGNVLALAGLETSILKSATLSSTPLCRPIAPLMFQATPIVQVAVEPAHPEDMESLERGLELLHRADPLVQVSLQESGEHVVSAAGEIHLETCIKDLKERFAKVKLVVSPPLVRFKESIADDTIAPKVIEASTPGKGCLLRIRVSTLPDKVCSDIESMENVLSRTFNKDSNVQTSYESFKSYFIELRDCIAEAMCVSSDDTPPMHIWQLGPKRHGPNVLLSSSGRHEKSSVWDIGDKDIVKVSKAKDIKPVSDDLDDSKVDPDHADIMEISIPIGSPIVSKLLRLRKDIQNDADDTMALARTLLEQAGILKTEQDDVHLIQATASAIHSVASGVSAGFQMASLSGPLCDEPLRGLLVEVEAKLLFSVSKEGTCQILTQEDVFGPFNGQVSATVRQAIRKAILENKPRIVEAHFLCEISTSSEGLAAVYAVLGRRRAKILREELKEGSGLFIVLAHLPVEASFGFADELRRKSSGSASASLMLSHWGRLDLDPFFQPLTEEEREEFGEEGQGVGAPNLAKRLIDDVRRRKGLQVGEKVVESATKQRTRARKV